MQHHADAAGVRHSLGNWHLQRQQLDEAEQMYRAALERRTLLAKEHPEVSELCRDMARTHNNLGVVHRKANRLEEAMTELRTVVNLFDGMAKKEPNEPEHRFELARAHVNLGSVKRARNDRSGAATEYQQAAVTLEKLEGGRPAWRAMLAAAHNNHGELTKSEKSLRKALELLNVLAAESPSVTAYRRDQARCSFNLAGILAVTFRRAEAEKMYGAAVETFDRLTRAHPTVPEYALDLGMSCQTLASLHALAGQTESVIEYADRAVAALGPLARNKQFPNAPGLVRGALVQRATARMKLGRHADAVRDWDRIIELDGGKTPRAYLLERAGALARSGQHVRAVVEVDALLTATTDGGELYDLGCLLSLSSATARVDANLSVGEREPLASRLADRAVSLLERSFEAGYLKKASAATHLRNDSDLNPIRTHAGFGRLLDKLPR
jgi:tetratricopeptide (TPR) repeat protein